MKNEKITTDHFWGLDIGTNSCGWAVTDTEYTLLKAKGKTLWGVRLFDEAKTAQERRLFRTARRRLERKKQRVKLLQAFFAPEISQVDMSFFQRLSESKFIYADKKLKERFTLFADSDYSDKDFHKEFPTIFHLRHVLSSQWSKKYDIRLVYIAIQHIMKNRGHFLFEGSSIEQVLSFETVFAKYLDVIGNILDIHFDTVDYAKIETILKQKKSRSDKKRELYDLLHTGEQELEKQEKALMGLLVGLKTKFSDIFNDESFNDAEEKNVEFSNNYEDNVDTIENILSTDNFEVIQAAKAVYDTVILAGMLKGEKSLSLAKIKDYEKHKSDKALLKKLLKHDKETYKKVFIEIGDKLHNYPAYVYSHAAKSSCAKQKARYEDFKKFLKPIIEKLQGSEAQQILAELENNTFLPKQVNVNNGVIPFQLHKLELDAILEQASKYYDFFNIVDNTGFSVKQKIQKVFTFKIPYYVGPINTAHSEKLNNKQAWAVKKSDEKVRPWNFENIIDTDATAEKFITRMTNKCTYLQTENVLPKNSLLYSEYVLLNEINPLCIKGVPLSVALKQKIVEQLFKVKAKVTIKNIVDLLKTENAQFVEITKEDISGIDVETGIKSSLRSYLDFKDFITLKILSEEQIEEIIRILTLFGDDKILSKNRIKKEFSFLNEDQLNEICSKKYKDWGRFSKRLLVDVTAQINKGSDEYINIINALRTTNYNLMQLLSKDLDFYKKINAINEKQNPFNKKINYSVVKDLYVSPAVKRQIWQTLTVVKELKKVLKTEPKKIFVEVARGEEEKKRTVSRKKQLEELYKNCKEEGTFWAKELEGKTDTELRDDRLYLYYTQMGKCMYCAEKIELDNLYNSNLYDIDHIYPRSLTNDDSLTNRVLVKKTINAQKTDTYPLSTEIRNNSQLQKLWKLLKDKQLISDKKYNRLVRTSELTKDELAGFINRQLVETRQSTKAVAEILQKVFPDTAIVFSKAGNVSDFRKNSGKFSKDSVIVAEDALHKVREINDFHHAHDAYLNIVVGNVFHVKFTNSPVNFINNAQPRSYNLYRMYDYDIAGAWQKEKTREKVKATLAQNNILVTRLAFIAKGGFFNQNPIKKTKGQLPLKELYKQLPDYKDNYGGFDNVFGAYFTLVEHTVKNKRIRTLENIPIHIANKIKKREVLLQYCKNDLQLVEPDIRIAKIKMNSLLCIDGYFGSISGRSNDTIVIRNEIQLVLSKEFVETIRIILKFLYFNTKYAVDISSFGINKEKNLALYNEFIRKLSSTVYSKRLGIQATTLTKLKENFEKLELKNQCEVIKEILYFFQCNRVLTNLKQIDGGGSVGSIKISKNISTNKSILLVTQSPTGLFEKRINLLTI